jgi:ankyrin repeat protein
MGDTATAPLIARELLSFTLESSLSLHEACQQCDAVELKSLLSSFSGDINELHNGRTILYTAARSNRLDIVQVLLDAGASPNAGSDGKTPLFVASREGFVDVAELLSKHPQSSVDLVHNGGTPFFEACWRGHLTIADKLARRGGCINFRTEDGATPLFAACREGHLEVVKFLIDLGVDLNLPDNNGVTPFAVACHEGCLEIVHALCQAHCDTRKKCNSGKTPIYYACQGGQVEILKFLISLLTSQFQVKEDGPDIVPLLLPGSLETATGPARSQTSKPRGRTFGLARAVEVFMPAASPPSSFTSLLLSPEPISLTVVHNPALLQHLQAQDNRGRAPAFAAAAGGHVKILELLHEFKCDLDKPDHDMYSPVCIACERGFAKVIKFLATIGCNIQPRLLPQPFCEPRVVDPLFIASGCGHTEVVNLLLSVGCRINTRNSGGATSFYIACQEGHLDIVRLLIDAGCDISTTLLNGTTPFFAACLKGHEHVVRYLASIPSIDKEAGINGSSPLFMACASQRHNIVKLLLTLKCDPNHPNGDGYTPVWVASSKGDVASVDLLCANACDVNSPCGPTGVPPVYIASRYGHREAVRRLLAAGCNVNVHHKGVSAFMIACYCGYFEIAHDLARAGANLTDVSKRFYNAFGLTPETSRIVNSFVFMYEFTKRPVGMLSSEALLQLPSCVAAKGLGAIHRHIRITKDQIYAMCAGYHPRLGCDSVVRFLPLEIIQMISQHLVEQQPRESTMKREQSFKLEDDSTGAVSESDSDW